eukprot:scaffold2480_cov385-Prasinococcus_capsulatus_cf.AAC.4
MLEAPKPKPAMYVRACSSPAYELSPRSTPVSPIRPKPTTMRPMTVPLANARRRAGSRPVMAAAVVRTLARTATAMPRYPVSAESAAPSRKASAVADSPIVTVSSVATPSTKSAR